MGLFGADDSAVEYLVDADEGLQSNRNFDNVRAGLHDSTAFLQIMQRASRKFQTSTNDRS